MDMASALELVEEGGLEASTSQAFVALKALHQAKVKLLVNSIDSLQQKLKEAEKESKTILVELGDVKYVGRDGQRSAMIQSLRAKVKDQGRGCNL